MKINIQPPASVESKKLMLHVNKQIKLLGKEFKPVSEADIKLRHDVGAGDKVCEIYLKVAGKNIFAIQRGRTYEIANDRAIAKLRGQVTQLLQPAGSPAAEASAENNHTTAEEEGTEHNNAPEAEEVADNNDSPAGDEATEDQGE